MDYRFEINTGGNMYPILLGLKEFIGNNVIFGGFRDAHNKLPGNWEIKEGKLLIDGIALDGKTGLDYPIITDIPLARYSGESGPVVPAESGPTCCRDLIIYFVKNCR